jgi:hypothetical protein
MTWRPIFGLAASTFLVLTVWLAPASAKNNCTAINSAGNCNNGGQQQDFNFGNRHNLGVPAPLAGAGLPFLILAGGYALVRLRRARSQ